MLDAPSLRLSAGPGFVSRRHGHANGGKAFPSSARLWWYLQWMTNGQPSKEAAVYLGLKTPEGRTEERKDLFSWSNKDPLRSLSPPIFSRGTKTGSVFSRRINQFKVMKSAD